MPDDVKDNADGVCYILSVDQWENFVAELDAQGKNNSDMERTMNVELS